MADSSKTVGSVRFGPYELSLDCEELRRDGNRLKLTGQAIQVLVVLANIPHVLDPRPRYTCGAVRVTAWRGQSAFADDPIRTSTPEALRAFENVEDYFQR